jgi:hypothetical protein
MSTANTTDALLSRRELIRWFDAWRPWPRPGLGELEITELEEPVRELMCEAELRAEDKVLFMAGSVCMHYGQRDLWKAIYSVVYPPGSQDALEWLEERTAAARRGDL